MSIDQWLEEATPRRVEVPVCFDGILLSRLEQAKARLVDLGSTGMLGDEQQLGLKVEIEQLEAEVREKTRLFVFEGIGWGRWRDLVSKHPPQTDQTEVFQRAIELALLPASLRDLDVNEQTFVPAALVMTCVEPGIADTAEALRLLESIPTGVVDRIWAGVMKVNHGGQNDPFVKGSIGFVEALATTKK